MITREKMVVVLGRFMGRGWDVAEMVHARRVWYLLDRRQAEAREDFVGQAWPEASELERGRVEMCQIDQRPFIERCLVLG